MAKTVDIDSQVKGMLADIKAGKFSPVYLLMGEESYYTDIVCDAIVAGALTDEERDFNQTIFYGLDADALDVMAEARSYPVMGERRLVLLREAQLMKNLEEMAVYCAEPMESTVLVIHMHGGSADKRRPLYRNVQKYGVVLESVPIKEWNLTSWISNYYRLRGLTIAPDAAALLGESTGEDLKKIVLETDKIVKNLPEGSKAVSVGDIERNVGLSRQYSIFSLTRELSCRNRVRAFKMAANISSSAKFAMPMATAALHTHFSRILRYEALLMQSPNPDSGKKSAVLGVNSYFFKEYDTAVRNYPLRNCMNVLSLIEEYDMKGKGGGGGEATPAALFMELISKILA